MPNMENFCQNIGCVCVNPGPPGPQGEPGPAGPPGPAGDDAPRAWWNNHATSIQFNNEAEKVSDSFGGAHYNGSYFIDAPVVVKVRSYEVTTMLGDPLPQYEFDITVEQIRFANPPNEAPYPNAFVLHLKERNSVPLTGKVNVYVDSVWIPVYDLNS